MIEAITAFTLLAATTAGLVKFAQIHSLIQRTDTRDFAARTMATNTVERLRQNLTLSTGQLQEQINQVRSPFTVRIKEVTIDTEEVTGSYYVVSVHESRPLRTTVKPLAEEHFWRLEPTSSSVKSEVAP